MEQRLIELEIKISYQERLLQGLSDVVAAQQQQIDALEKEISKLRTQLGAVSFAETTDPEDDVPPPHY